MKSLSVSRHSRQAHYPTDHYLIRDRRVKGGGCGYGQEYGYSDAIFGGEECDGYGGGNGAIGVRENGSGHWCPPDEWYDDEGGGYGIGFGFGYPLHRPGWFWSSDRWGNGW